MFVDSTCILPVEKRTGPDRMGRLGLEQYGMLASNKLGLETSHGEIVHATGRAAPPTLQTRRVFHFEDPDTTIDLMMEIDET
jgi:hypothetical protein